MRKILGSNVFHVKDKCCKKCTEKKISDEGSSKLRGKIIKGLICF